MDAKPTPNPTPAPASAGPAKLPLLQRVQASRAFKGAAVGWRWRRGILLGAGLSYAAYKYQMAKLKARARDRVPDKTYLYWKIYDGGIVEAKSTGSSLNYLLNSSSGAPEEPPRVMSLFEVIRALKFVEADDRIHGIIADFSSTSVPSVPSYNLGLAQIEEIQDAMLELRRTKQEKFGTGENGWRTVAFSDSFYSQGQFLFASLFDEVYCQPTGEVPLVGMGSTMPFFGRLAKWLGIDVHAEARNEYKSFVQPYIDEKLTGPQKANQVELINDLNDNLLTYIGRNRFPDEVGQAGLDKVKALTQRGPFTATQAVQEGLLSGTSYRQNILDSVFEPDDGGDDERKLFGFYHYHKVMERAVEKNTMDVMDVGVVYLMGAIGDAGEFGTASVVKGLKEAGEDDSVGAVVLRIDSGGGGVVESDTIWAAVRDLREKYGKTVVASFGNASASGGYLVSTHADAILAAPSTVTGSIGVASLRPTFLTAFFDRFHVTLDSVFTGSRSIDPTHSLTPEELVRHKIHVDEMYDDFKRRVCEGRGIHPDVIDLVAGGRVMTGLKAFTLTAPEELIRSIKGLDSPPPTPESASAATTSTDSSDAPIETSSSAVAVIAEEQETSPFAPPASTQSPIASVDESNELPNSAEANALVALKTSTPEEQAPVSYKAPPSGIYPVKLGAFGRGLVDGIGGIRDAAVYACELFIANGIAGFKEDNPGVSDDDAIRALLPTANFQKGPNGEMIMQTDVRLKRFPVTKSFWTQLNEVNNRGDSMDVSALGDYVKSVAATWLIQLAAGIISSEMDDLGLMDARRGLGLGPTRRKNWMRAEWSGVNLR